MTEFDIYQKNVIKCNQNTLVIAGAGSGKTTTIIGKINYLLKNNIYQKNEILVLSFTNKSIDDLKKKINYNISILTFHKLAIQILNDYHIKYNLCQPNYLNYIANEFFQSLTNPNLIKEILTYFSFSSYLSFLKSKTYKYLLNIIISYIHLFKTNSKTYEDLKLTFNNQPFLTKLISIIWQEYEQELKATKTIDFDDLIKIATQTLNSFYRYKYIIIDEFQDTSYLRFNLIYQLFKINHAKILAVGDDFQSIYHFSGCNLDIFLNFSKLIPNSKILKLKYTYRNSQELINIAGKFILKNNKQIKKSLISNKHLYKPINYIYYLNSHKILVKLLAKLINKYDDILILGRNNNDINYYLNSSIFKEKDYILYKNKQIRYLTIHSAKGLEAQTVIIINLTNKLLGFPSQINKSPLLNLINNETDNYLDSEERRLFYVALTRSQNEVYLLCPLFQQSYFIKEIKKINPKDLHE